MNTDELLQEISQKENLPVHILRVLFGSRVKKAITLSVIVLTFSFYISLIRVPSDFPIKQIIKVEEGSTLKDITVNFESSGAIRSPFLFRAGIILLGGEKSSHAGEYYLDEKEGVFTLAYRITRGVFGLTPITVLVPEGLNNKEVALHLSNTIETFDMAKFISLSKSDEGYLFPDTYYFLPNVSEEEVYKTMKDNFNTRLKEVSKEMEDFMKSSGVSIEDIITMASIIELEAMDFETKREISGVLWNRIDVNMALQVDASFAYLLGKGTSQLSLEDLQIDSPYNTYKYRGLPPGPIANPGLDSILAAVTPNKHGYYYYLADKSGITHFSKTFAEHSRKKAQYID